MNLTRIKSEIEKLSPANRLELARWLSSSMKGAAPAAEPGSSNKPNRNPAATNRKLLPGFALKRIPQGWKGRFPGGLRLFDRPVLVIAETESDVDFSKLPAPLSSLQAGLVQKIARGLGPILKRAKREVGKIGIDLEDPEDGHKVRLNIYVWLHFNNDDGESWELVVERADGSSFGYHLAHQGTKFIESWAGD